MQDTSWIDRVAYPFESHYFEVDGARMHYVDEGQGAPVVMVHGTPTWSFLYRHMIKALSPHYRCIVPDHLGFGLSDKPEHIGYYPRDHARRLRALIEHLGLRDLTLVVHDFGGPIGLSYAIEQPDNVRAVVLFNTWLWSLQGELIPEAAGISSRGPIGTFLFEQLNYEVHVVFKSVWGDRSKLTRDLHQQYIRPFPQPRDRQSVRLLARELRASSAWYDALWAQRERIKDIPTLLLWGGKDLLFKTKHLTRWQSLFTNAQTVTFPESGHFVQEEAPDKLNPIVAQFLEQQISQ
ncbi:MAG: alpha/beta fold hydrolase [Chloroflexota bacterium]